MISFLSVGFTLTTLSFLALNFYLRSVTEDFVQSFLATESVNLQEGQILPAFARGQRLLIASHFITGIAVADISSKQRLYEMGASVRTEIAVPPQGESRTETTGLFSYRIGLPAQFGSNGRFRST
ncbi:MAG: hypothetical protein HC902_07705, partial [Calothrix sp. SM1_5_4]|nr:hypothetical protein [Calothrix sp. SM1_5_4]